MRGDSQSLTFRGRPAKRTPVFITSSCSLPKELVLALRTTGPATIALKDVSHGAAPIRAVAFRGAEGETRDERDRPIPREESREIHPFSFSSPLLLKDAR